MLALAHPYTFGGDLQEICPYPSLFSTCSSHTHGPNWTPKWTFGLRRLHTASSANSGRKSYGAGSFQHLSDLLVSSSVICSTGNISMSPSLLAKHGRKPEASHSVWFCSAIKSNYRLLDFSRYQPLFSPQLPSPNPTNIGPHQVLKCSSERSLLRAKTS